MNVDKFSALDGLVSPEVGAVLAEMAAQVPVDQAIVEIGSYKGKSTCYLAAGARDGHGAHVYAVDAWDTEGNVTGRFRFTEARDAFDRQIRSARLVSRITALQGFSTDVAARWDGPPIGLLFIDADHAEASVRADYEAWKPHLAPGAVVIFDDYLSSRSPGVRAAVKALGLHVSVAADWLAVA